MIIYFIITKWRRQDKGKFAGRAGGNWVLSGVDGFFPQPKDFAERRVILMRRLWVGSGWVMILLCCIAAESWAQVWIDETDVPGLGAENLNDVVFIDASIAVAVGDGGDIVRSIDAGDTWTQVADGSGWNNENLNAVFSYGSTIIAVGVNDGGTSTIVRSINGGAAWSLRAVAGDPGEPLHDGVFVTASIIVVVGDDDGGASSVILVSTDSGTTWTDKGGFGTDYDEILYAVDANGSTVIAVGQLDTAGDDRYVTYQSTDYGDTWTYRGDVDDAYDQTLNDVVFVSATTVVAVGNDDAGGPDNSVILQSTNGGTSWNGRTVTGDIGVDLNAVAASGGTVIAVGDQDNIPGSDPSNINQSTNSGATWTYRAPPTNDVDLFDVASGSLWLAVGTGGTIFASTDGGTTWSAQTSGTLNNLNAIAFSSGITILVVGVGGTILRNIDQITISSSIPIPFRSKWLLVLLLAGYGVWAINKYRTGTKIQAEA